MGKKILVLGVGPSQVDLIELCNKNNMKVYACAHEDKGPGRSLVDEFRVIDIKDISAVQEFAKEKQVDYVFTLASEVGVKTMALVSENLGLPHFISSEAANILSNKSKWRSHLGNIEGNLAFMTGKTVSDFKLWDRFPAILKPIDGSGQRGVYPVESYLDIEKYFDNSIKFSRLKELILEEMAVGPEVSVNAFMNQGELSFAIISDRISYKDYPGGIIKEHHIPSKVLSEVGQERVYTLLEKVCKKTGFNDGPVYFQLKIENDYPKLIEYTPRFDGCHMWRLIKESCGIDLRKVALEWLEHGFSEILNNYKNKAIDGNYKLIFISDTPGTIVKKEQYFIPDEHEYLEWYYEEDEKVTPVTGHIEKIGYYILKGK